MNKFKSTIHQVMVTIMSVVRIVNIRIVLLCRYVKPPRNNFRFFWGWVDLIYLNCTEREVSRAFANLLRSDNDGVLWPLSTLEITDCLVLSFLAS